MATKRVLNENERKDKIKNDQKSAKLLSIELALKKYRSTPKTPKTPKNVPINIPIKNNSLKK